MEPFSRRADQDRTAGDELDAALADAQKGDEWGISVLYRSFNPGLVRYLQQHSGAAADDLASETWLGAAVSLPRFEGDSNDFRALLYTIAKRRLIDHYRAQHRLPTLVGLSSVQDLEGSVRSDTMAVESESVVVEHLSSNNAIAALVGSLSKDQAEVVLLRVVADLSVEQVARVLDKSPGAVRVLQHRALRSLRRTSTPAVTLEVLQTM